MEADETKAAPPPILSKEETQQAAIKLIDKVEAQREETKKLQKELDALLEALPSEELFADKETKIVYRATVPTGTYIEFRRIGYEHSRKEGETKGTVTIKEATEYLASLK